MLKFDVLCTESCVVCGEDMPITAQAFELETVCPECGAVYAPLHLDLVREAEDPNA